MSRRVKRPLAKKSERAKSARGGKKVGGRKSAPLPPRSEAKRRGGVGGHPAPKRVSTPASATPTLPTAPRGEVERANAPLPTKVQTVIVTADENNMRVDRFLEHRFPGLSFSHIQRIVRKGELRINGKRADSKDRLEEGQSVRIPPLKLDAPKVAQVSEAQQKTLDALKAMTLYEDADVMCRKSPRGVRCRAATARRARSTSPLP